MRAVRIRGTNEAVLEDIPRPTPAADEVLFAVERVQLSVTECRLYRGQDIAHRDAVDAQLANGPARLFGHEFCGRVVEIGSEVDGFDRGDRVYPPGKLPCEDCAYCATGYHQYCPRKIQLGYDRPGGLSEYVCQPASVLRRVPESVSPAVAAALQPLASAVLCVVDAGITPGDTVATVGTGVMGSHCGVLAREFGATTIFGADVAARKLAIVEEHGIEPVDVREDDLAERVKAATGGIGADVVFEAVGADQSHGTAGDDPLAVATRTVRAGGSIVQVGHIEGEIVLRPRSFRTKWIDWINPSVGTTQFGPNMDSGELAVELAESGRIPVEAHVSHELGGLEHFEEAVEITLDPERGLGPAQLIVG